MDIRIEISDRLKNIPPYLFAEIDRKKKEAIVEGRDIIDLGIGDPDQPTPSAIIKALNKAAKDPSTHRYALDRGMKELKEEIARWYKDRFNVILDADREILPLIGSKEGIAHMPLAFINPGDIALVPNPCYPPYRSGVIFAGGDIHDMPLEEENSFLPKLESIDSSILNKTRLIFLNYPNSPTGAVCDRGFYKEVVDFGLKNNIIICNDAAYTELSFDGFSPPSLLEADGAKEIGVEFHSFSKTFNMTGWRIGWACGNKDIIEGLSRLKSNIDSGIFNAIQRAGIAALKMYKRHIGRLKMMYQERRDILVDGLNSIGWRVEKPKATFYLWAKTLAGRDSASMCKLLLDETDVVATPGIGFGNYGEGYVRMAITVSKDRLKEAVKRIKRII